jgi:CheY-like chemotaxis protein
MALSTSPESTAISLLCVDDDPQILTLLKSFLEREPGFIVETSTSASEALDLLNTRHFDAILSDYYMPDMDGIALLREIRARGIPALFVIFTGRHIARVAIDTLNNGGNFYIQKGPEFLEDIPKLVDFLRSHKAKGIPDEGLSSHVARSCSFAEHQIDLLAGFLPDGTVTFMNDSCARFMGFQNPGIPVTNFFLQVPEPGRGEVIALIAALSPDKPGIYIEHPFNSPNGTSRLFQWGYSAVFSTDGSAREYFAQGRDTSKVVRLAGAESSKAPADAMVSQESPDEIPAPVSTVQLTGTPGIIELAESVESLQYPIFAVDPEGKVIAWNDAIAEVTGIPAYEIIGKGNHAYAVPFYGEPRPMLVDYILSPGGIPGSLLPQTIKRDGDAFIGSVENISIRGKPMLMGGRATAIHDAGGTLFAAVQSILVSEHHLGGTIDSLYEDEHYIGGVSSVILKVTGKGLAGAIAGAIGSAAGGYGVYATDQRLFVVHNPQLDATKNDGVQFGTFIVDELFGTNVDLGSRSIPDLERMKVFEVWRYDLVSIEMKKPRLLAGYLVFQTKNGESFRVYIDHQKAFTHIEQLMMLFYPEILKDQTQTIDTSEMGWIDEIQTFDLVGNLQLDDPLKDIARPAKNLPGSLFPHSGTQSPRTVTPGAWTDLNLAIEPIQYPIFAIDKTGKVIAWNTAIAKLTGVSAKNIIGKGDRAYAVPFYGEARPMLIDYIVMSPDTDIPGAMPNITREGDTFIGDIENVTIGGKPMILWGKGTGIYDPKGTVIAAIQSILVSEQQVPKYADEELFEETYIGGLSSITVKIGREGTAGAIAGALGSTTGGYGVYATDQRLFIIHNPELDASKTAGLQFGTFIVDELFGTTVDTRPRTIKDLESRKVFEVSRRNIASIEMKKPVLLAGYLIFKTKAGESFRVYIDHKRAYIHLDQLLKMFYPEITRFE